MTWRRYAYCTTTCISRTRIATAASAHYLRTRAFGTHTIRVGGAALPTHTHTRTPRGANARYTARRTHAHTRGLRERHTCPRTCYVPTWPHTRTAPRRTPENVCPLTLHRAYLPAPWRAPLKLPLPLRRLPTATAVRSPAKLTLPRCVGTITSLSVRARTAGGRCYRTVVVDRHTMRWTLCRCWYTARASLFYAPLLHLPPRRRALLTHTTHAPVYFAPGTARLSCCHAVYHSGRPAVPSIHSSFWRCHSTVHGIRHVKNERLIFAVLPHPPTFRSAFAHTTTLFNALTHTRAHMPHWCRLHSWRLMYHTSYYTDA